jgi:hypothetical protein
MNEPRLALIKDLLQLSMSELSDAQSTFAGLDNKAQNTTAIGGIFLAGALAFFNGDSLPKIISVAGHMELVLLGAAVVLLTISIGFCIWAIRIQEVSIVDVMLSNEEVTAILDQPSDELPRRYENYLLSQIEDCSGISSNLRDVNRRKATAVRRAQLALGGAVLVATGLLLYTLFSAWNQPLMLSK